MPPRILRCFNHREEAEVIAAEIASEISRGIRQPRDYAIFYRMNALSRNLEHALYRYGIPFQLIRGLEFFNRKEIKDILAYMQLVYNANDTIAFQRVINLPARGIGRVSLGRLTSFAALEGISLMEAARHVQKIPGIPIRTKKAVEKFVALIDRLGEVVVATNLETMLSVLLAETKYTAGLQESKTEEDGQRLANVQELLSEVREFDRSFDEEESRNSLASPPMAGGPSPENFDRLGRFLEKSALVSDVDTLDDQMNSVSLMTFHAAKGLEFPVVYLVAIEDNIIPHERSGKIQAQIEEERRLLFVGMTRAKEELRLSRTQFRDYRGMYTSSLASRFLFDITGDALQQFDSPDEMNSELLAPKELVSQLENRESEGRQEEYDEIPVYRQLETAGNNDSIPVSSEIPEKIPEWNGFGKGISVLKKSSQILSLSDYLEKVPDDFQGGASVFRDGRTLSDETTDFPAERDLRFDFHARN
ncbi:MAG: ATP-binding domain-containing protein, partial [Thermoguttaceae bacterium]|nr:ATP-binding domain-containing protein [Thermoguttaceae bacterium]